VLKSKLIENINENFSYLTNKEAEESVNIIFSEIINALTEGKRVELRGFGSFSIKNRIPRIARNPKTGESVEVGSKLKPYFRSGKDLNDLINS
tara:strand:+ start:14125 stop:14403 length:279 start_codon:yes stop_codon:yes gene_type:complete